MVDGKVVVVTGAGRGLGRAYARALAGAGAAVVVNDLDGESAADTVATIRAAGGCAVAGPGDVGEPGVADGLVGQACGEFGRLDGMCTNAGGLRDSTLHRTSDDDFNAVVRSHLFGTFACGRAAVRAFRHQGTGGRLLLVSSPAGQRAAYGQTAYSAAKAAVVGLTRTWALECRGIDVTVNAVLPRAVTRMTAGIPGLSRLVRDLAANGSVPADLRAAGLGTCEDVAPLVVYLLSDRAAHVTGQCLGAGGDQLSLWSHPAEIVVASRPGGWQADALAETFDRVFAPQLQGYEQTLLNRRGPGAARGPRDGPSTAGAVP